MLVLENLLVSNSPSDGKIIAAKYEPEIVCDGFVIHSKLTLITECGSIELDAEAADTLYNYYVSMGVTLDTKGQC